MLKEVTQEEFRQEAGKGLVLMPDKEEVPFLLENLSHKGLHMNVRNNPTPEEAESLLRMAVKLAH